MNGLKRARPIRTFLMSILVIVAYFALFPYPMGRELVARPVWVRDLAQGAAMDRGGIAAAPRSSPVEPDAGAADGSAGVPTPFRLNGLFGYLSADGDLLYVERPAFAVALSETGFITYSRVGTTFIFQDPLGRKTFNFTGAGYPLLSEDGGRLFTVKSDTTGLSELDRNGQRVWSRDFSSHITSLSVQPGWVLAGLLDGKLELLDANGASALDFTPMGSRISVILGAAVSPDGSTVAAVSGIDPQSLVVLKKRDKGYAQIFQAALGTQFRREVRVKFSPDGRFLVFEGNGSARVYDTRSRELGSVALTGGLSSFCFLPRQALTVLLGGDPLTRELVVAKSAGAVYSRERFTASAVYMGNSGDGILLGVDSKLLRIDLEEM